MSDPTPIPDDPGSITPNKVITDPAKRRTLGLTLYVLLFVAAAAQLVLVVFPELTFGTDYPTRAILLITSLVTLTGGFFGVVVTTPNVPKGA